MRDERCNRCISSIPADEVNKGKLNENISWEIIDGTVYISGKGPLTQDDYIVISAPAPGGSTITYRRVLPWAVCPGIRKSKIIGETCPVYGISNYVKGVVVRGEVAGVDEFLRNSNNRIGG